MLGTNLIRANRYSRPGRIEQVRYYREQGSKEGLNSDVIQRTPDKRTMPADGILYMWKPSYLRLNEQTNK